MHYTLEEINILTKRYSREAYLPRIDPLRLVDSNYISFCYMKSLLLSTHLDYEFTRVMEDIEGDPESPNIEALQSLKEFLILQQNILSEDLTLLETAQATLGDPDFDASLDEVEKELKELKEVIKKKFP